MCNILKTADRRAKWTKLGVVVLQCIICSALLMSHSLRLVWGHSVHFAKFPILRFSKLYISPLYLGNGQSQSKTDQNMGLRGKYLVYTGFFQFKFSLGSFGAFPIFDTLYLGNGQSQRETDENLDLWVSNQCKQSILNCEMFKFSLGSFGAFPIFDTLYLGNG